MRLKRSDESAMTEIFNRYWERLLAIAYNRLGNLEEAEECVQDVLLKLWRLRDQLELRYTLYTYLAAGIRYRAYDLLSRAYRKHLPTAQLREGVDVVEYQVSADWNVREQELLAQIATIVDHLPHKCRIVYLLKYEEGRSNAEIAHELGISTKTVEAHITKANREIRDGLKITIPLLLVYASMGL